MCRLRRARTLKNYESRPPYTQMSLGLVQALAMVLEYDLQAILCLPPFDSDDDTRDLANASLEPTCWGTCQLPGGAAEDDRIWEIFEYYDDMSLVVVRDPKSPRVSSSDERYFVPRDATGAYEVLTLALNLEAGRASPEDVAEERHAKLPEPRVSEWVSTTQASRTSAATRENAGPIHIRRDARERDAIAELGHKWSFRESDGERCPYLVVDGHHDVELRGFSAEVGCSCEISLWHVPDMGHWGQADEVGVVTGVPCARSSVELAIDYIAGQVRDSGTYKIAFRDIPRQTWQ